jgi:sentrin-specific protease 7
VDIFSKQFLFVPIHGGLHWSVAVICHAGLDPAICAQLGSPPTAPASEGATVPLAASAAAATPCILHLDSTPGMHDTEWAVQPLYSYLALEWKKKVRGCGVCVWGGGWWWWW